MRRPRVWFDARAQAAAAAAARLRGAFEVGALAPEEVPEPATPGVILVDPDAADRPAAAHVRLIGVVDPAAAGPWPAHWWTLVPAGAARPLLARVVDQALADLDRAAEVARLERELSELNAIGIRLSAERDPHALLETILRKAREITQSDAGSLYLVEEAPDGAARLRFVLAQNDSVPIEFTAETLPLSSQSVAGHAALTGQIVNLADAYAPPPDAPFQINRSFDERTGYRTKSMLVVPMRTPQGETIGALQLINAKPDSDQRLDSRAAAERVVIPYTARHEKLAGSLASQAAVAVHNSRLYESIRELFEGFVKASVTAIEARDPTTSGHSFRVANLTSELARVVDRTAVGPYAGVRFSRDELMELRYAALLHDFGKVGVREQVLVKAKKLYPGELERIQQRVALIKQSLELRCAQRKLEYLRRHGPARYAEQAAALDAELAAALARLDEAFERVVRANEPTVVPRELVGELERLARHAFEDHRGQRHTVITPEEARILAIPRGSLTTEEFDQLRSHVVHTFEFLAQIPWTREFRRIPDIARSHHEKLDGSGYPLGLTAPDIPVQTRMMTIADIYDALTAGDRPYKRGVSAEEALDILGEERRLGRIDSALFDLFVEAKVYTRVLGG